MAGVFGFSSVTFSFDSSRRGWGRRSGDGPGGGGGGGGGSRRTKGKQSVAMEGKTNAVAPAGLPDSVQGGLMGTPPQSTGVLGRGELSEPASTCLTGLPLRLRVGDEGRMKLDQGWGRRASEEILRTSPGAGSRAMLAPLAPSPSRRASRLGIPGRAECGGWRCLGAAGLAPAASPPCSSRPPPGTCN